MKTSRQARQVIVTRMISYLYFGAAPLGLGAFDRRQ